MRSFGILGVAALLAALGGGAAAVGCDSGTGDTGGTGGGADGGTDGPELVILDGGGEAASPPDGQSKCPQGGICNYQTGAGCPADHPACIPASDGKGGVAPACDIAGAGTSGAACTQGTDCAAGYLCADGQCHKLCCGGDWTGCPSANEHCLKDLVYGDGNGGTIATGAMLCYPVNNCSALDPSVGCAKPGTACLIADPTGATACLTAGNGGSGEACPCKGGFTCVVGESGNECRRLCKAVEGGGEPACSGGEGACVHYNRDPAGVGECTPQ